MTDAQLPLAERQAAFLRAILDESAPLPDGWSNRQTAGMAVYRGNYRSAVMGSLADTFERTALYAGAQPFAQASINHVIKHPPTGWTLDAAGAGFDQTCAKFFAGNPEIAELAWLEWAMLDLATAPDSTPMDPAGFGAATAEFGDEDWGGLRLSFGPRTDARLVNHDLPVIWRSLGDDLQSKAVSQAGGALSAPQTCLVWREGERPTFTMAEADHADAFAVMQGGATYGDLIGHLIGNDPEPDEQAVQNAAMRGGAILGRWLQEGILIGINP